MGIDFVVDLTCPPKEALSTPRIVERLKDRARAESVLAMARRGGDARPIDEIKFTRVLMRAGREERVTESIAESLARTGELDLHDHACESCPANVAHAPFGCIGYVGYPIEASTEQWLMALLPQRIGSTAGAILRHRVSERPGLGEFAARLRANGATFFENDDPLIASWKLDDETATLSSNELFDLLFATGPHDPRDALSTALILGLVPHETPPEDLDRALREPSFLALLLERSPLLVTTEEPQIDALSRFLQATCAAALLRVSVLVDG